MDKFCLCFLLFFFVFLGDVSRTKAEFQDVTATNFVLFTDQASSGHRVMLLDVDTGHIQDLKPSIQFKDSSVLNGIVYHSSSKTVYFAIGEEICKFKLGIGSDPNCIFKSTQHMQIRDLALDESRGKLYFSDPAGFRIYRMDTDGSNYEEVPTNIKNPTGIFVDEKKGFLYFGHVDYNDGNATLERSPLSDLTKREVIFTSQQSLPYSLFIDGETLYWVDNRKNQVKASNLDGSHFNVVATVPGPGTSRICGITGVGAYLYVADNEFGEIVRVDPNHGKVTTIGNGTNIKPYMLAGSKGTGNMATANILLVTFSLMFYLIS